MMDDFYASGLMDHTHTFSGFRRLSPERSDPSAFVGRAIKRAKFSGGAKAEAGYRRVALDAAVASKHPRGRSEKSRAAWRNDPLRDEEIFNVINKSLRARQPIRLTRSSSDLVCGAEKNLKEAKRAGRRIIPEIGVPHWDHASELLKMLGWGLASQELGATPFTLRLSKDVIAAGMASPRGLARYLQDRISRHLRYRLPQEEPTFWFVVEQGLGDEPHLHGAILISSGREDVVRSALRAAGGCWQNPARQCSFGMRGNLPKWVGYCTKWLWRSKCIMGDENLIGATQSIRRASKKTYQDSRANSAVLYP